MQILYFANPMCSWCWGFAPVIMALADRYAGRVEITPVLGSLGDRSRPMTERDKAYVRGHWERVRAMTGQPFDMAFFEREGFVYDTEAPSRAVLAVRTAAPGLALAYLHRLQEAFYVHNRDITAAAELVEEAVALGVEPGSLRTALGAPGLAEALRHEFRETAGLGVTGYPTLLALAPGRPELLSLGCQTLDTVAGRLEGLLAGAAAGG